MPVAAREKGEIGVETRGVRQRARPKYGAYGITSIP